MEQTTRRPSVWRSKYFYIVDWRIYWSAMNQKDKNLEKSIFFHFDMTFLTTLTGIFDFANLIFHTWI